MEGPRPAAGERVALFGGGVLLLLVGVPMLVLPGPGIAAILGGLWFMWRGATGAPPMRRSR